MSAEQLAAFWEAVEADASLQDKLRASIDGEIDTPLEVDAVITIAKDAGFIITAGDLLKADAQAILELNDDELQEVAGGLRNTHKLSLLPIEDRQRRQNNYDGYDWSQALAIGGRWS